MVDFSFSLDLSHNKIKIQTKICEIKLRIDCFVIQKQLYITHQNALFSHREVATLYRWQTHLHTLGGLSQAGRKL